MSRFSSSILIMLAVTIRLGVAHDFSSVLSAKIQTAKSGVYSCLLAGSITMIASTNEFYLQDQTSGVRVISDPYVLAVGEQMEVKGWIYITDSGEFQVYARQVWHVEYGSPTMPRFVTLREALEGAYEGTLVGVSGTVLNMDFGQAYDVLSIESGHNSLRVFSLAADRRSFGFDRIHPGRRVAITGISVPQSVDPESDGYQIRLRTPADLRVGLTAGERITDWLARPREWAAASMFAIGLAGACISIAVGRWSASRSSDPLLQKKRWKEAAG